MSAATVVLRFVHSNDLISRLIRQGELGFAYQHVECLMPDGALLGAHIEGGVLARPRGYDAGRFEYELFVTIPALPSEADAYHAFLVSQLGKPYGMGEIEGLAWGFVTGSAADWEKAGSWICSELQTKAALAAGLILSAVEPSTPRDVFGWAGVSTKIERAA